MQDDELACACCCGVLAIIFIPITFFITTAGLVCLKFCWASYTIWNILLAFLTGFCTGLEIFGGKYKPDPHLIEKMNEHTRRRKVYSDIARDNIRLNRGY